MRPTPVRRWWLVLLALVLGACSATPSPRPATGGPPLPSTRETDDGPAPKPAYTMAPSPTPIVQQATPAPELAGTPYTAHDVLAKLGERDYPPFPAELATLPVAAAVAASLYTFDGQPYRAWWVDGACSGADCTLSIQAIPAFAASELERDHQQWTIDLRSMSVTWVRAGIGGYPRVLDPRIDARVRALEVTGALDGLRFKAAGWLPPPDWGRWQVFYCADGGMCEQHVQLEVDLEANEIVWLVRSDQP